MTIDLTSHGIVAVIKNAQHQYLLLKDNRPNMLDHWAPPHGRCEPEDLTEEQSVVREVMEEVGLVAHPQKKLFTQKADTKTLTVSFWQTHVDPGEIVLDTSESSEYGWYTLDEALGLLLYPGTRVLFEKIQRGEINL